MDGSDDKCPICKGVAKEALPRIGDFAEFICDVCGRFRITGTALETARHEDNPEIRIAALDRAHARAAAVKSIPQITSRDF